MQYKINIIRKDNIIYNKYKNNRINADYFKEDLHKFFD